MSERPDGPPRPSGPPLGSDRPIEYREPRGWFRHHLRSIVVVAVVLLAVGGLVAAVLAVRNVGDVTQAQQTAAVSAPVLTTAAPSPTASASPSPSASASPTASPTTASGTVTSVVAVGQWMVAVQPGLEISVVTTPATTYPKGKSAQDVKQGSTITVVGTLTAGVVTATSVTFAKKTAT